jgi:23S rRNA pseudouridine2605 synthase
MSERVQKLLASAGHGSRREIEQWIRAGRLTVDGQVAALGVKAEPGADIRLDGRALSFQLMSPQQREVLLYHKPVGEVTTRSDPQGRPTVFERLPPPRAGRWVVIGRLDVNTTGLLLFTTDGALAHRMMHPSAEVQREYLVRVRGAPDEAVLGRLRAGVLLEDGPARFELLEPLQRGLGEPTQHSSFRVVLREGRNREVRRLWESVGFEVSRLMRRRFGAIELPLGLKAGQWQALDPQLAASL